MNTIQNRVTALERTVKMSERDVWDIIKERGLENGLALLEKMNVDPLVIQEIRDLATQARADAREWENRMFGKDWAGQE